VVPLAATATKQAERAARAEAKKVQTRLLNQVDERRNPRTCATINQLLDRYLELVDVEDTTRSTYEALIAKHIRPVIGSVMVARLDGELLDSFYARLRTCRAHCGGRAGTDHRTPRKHECDHRCVPHRCKPLAASSIRQVHGILGGAFKRAVRWRWVAHNPMAETEPPAPPRPDPRPPSAAEAARIRGRSARRSSAQPSDARRRPPWCRGAEAEGT
jgi:hypothetical protein